VVLETVAIIALVVAGVTLAVGPAPTRQPEPVSHAPLAGLLRASGGPYLTDRWGRVVVLHGVNAVYKRAPYELYVDPGQPWDFTETDAAHIAALGLNVVRLGIIWQGIEPGTLGPNNPRICTPGPPHDPAQWNSTVARDYLDHVAQTVAVLARYHVYTLLDMHEDIYSSAFGGEGAPLWAVCTDGLPIGNLPGRWSNTYADPALDAAVGHFWTNDVNGDLQGEYLRAWKAVAKTFRDNPWVVGYDPINEPFTRALTATPATGRSTPPAVAGELECLYTGSAHPGRSAFDGSLLHCPSQDPALGLIRTLDEADPTHLVFFEPDIYTSRGRPNDVGPMNLPNLVFNFHVYCSDRSPVTGDPTDLDECALQEILTMVRRGQERSGLASATQPAGPALFMSEFGATSSEALVARVTAEADALGTGWAYWAWRFYGDPTGSTDEALMSASGQLSSTAFAVSRTYPEAVAGIPTSFAFDPQSGAFHLDYVPDLHASAPTLIFVPVALHYPTGYCATAVGGSVLSGRDATSLIVANNPGASVVTITVRRGTCSATSG